MEEAVISTGNGKVRGKVVQLQNCKDGKPVSVYRKIPFAKPPIGTLRFMPPKPADPWNDVIDGTGLGSRPMNQYSATVLMEKSYPMPIPKGDIKMEEDCLHLSVYSTHPESGKNLPVMVYFYGGGFQIGSEVDHDATILAGLNDVVVVVPNYRVGMFGFFSLGLDSPCTGNAGILDQQMALKWVQQNIDVFGGDKKKVTIFGESAGGVSVHLNIVSPLSKGLFHKAISHSGQISMPILFNDDIKNRKALDVALKHFGIETKDPLEILQALQRVPADQLLTVNIELEKNKAEFEPMVDGYVFEKTPIEYLMKKEFPKIPYIIGCNSTEGSGLFAIFIHSSKDSITEQFARDATPLQLCDKGWVELKKYYDVKEDADGYCELLRHIHHDGFFAVPAIHDAKVHTESGAPVFVYLGDFQLKLHHSEEYGNVLKKPDNCVCDHGDDVFLTFGCPFSNNEQPLGAKYSREEEVLSRKWMTYLTNFAKSGDPNIGAPVAKLWPEFKTGELLVLNHEITTKKNYKEKEVKFWKDNIYSLCV